MAKSTPAPAPVETPEVSSEQPVQTPMDVLGDVIGRSVAQGIAATQPPRKLTIGDYVRRGAINQYHPDPKVKLKFDREYYQNGRLIEFETTFDREVELLNQITHSGRYVNRLVEVVVIQNGSEEAVDIRFSNKKDKAFELKGHARDFTHMLEQIVAAQKEERAEMEDDKADRAERRAARQSSFGNNKASREARERAGV